MSNNQQLTKQPATSEVGRPIDMLKTMISSASVQAQFKNALGAHKDTFVASLIDLFTGDKSLQKCKPAAIISEALRAATLNLPLNKALGFSYIVVYNNNVKDPVTGAWSKVPTPTFIPGYKGYIQLAMRTGQYKTINADYVYEGELRKVNKLSGEIAFDGDKVSDKVVGYFCYFELLNGFSKTLYMSVENMAEYAKRYSPSIKSNKELTVEKLIEKAQSGITSTTVGWEGNFNDMALKTVIRRLLSKYGYLSVEMVNAISKDEEIDNAAAVRNSENDEDLTTVDVEGVDVTTGEVLGHSAPSAQAIPSAAMPAGPAY